MSVSGAYLVLNDKNIQKLRDKLSFDVDDILHFARNGEINLYIRVESIPNGSRTIRTEFNELFELSGFLNEKIQERAYEDFFQVADYNVDYLTEDNKDEFSFGICYGFSSNFEDKVKEKKNLALVHFDGFIKIPERTINESARKITLDNYSAYYFLNNKYGDTNFDFCLNFSFQNGFLDVPIQNTYILIEQLALLADKENRLEISINEAKTDPVIIELEAENESLKARIAELENKVQSAVDYEEVLEKNGRVSSPQRAIFSLLVSKNYQGFDSRNSLFLAVNSDLQKEKIITKPIKYDTLNKLIDEDLAINNKIFPNKD